LLAAMLAAAGLRTAAVGNIGTPIVDVVLGAGGPHDVLAVELSSYQLHWAPGVRPHSAAVLNLAPDHLDWHGSMAGYAADKGRIYRGNRVACVYNAADPATERLVREADVTEGCRAIGFTPGAPGPSQLGVVDGLLVDRAFVADRQRTARELAEVADVRPPAPHNIANALAAAEWIESVGRFTASEADPPRLTALRRRFSDDPRVTVRELEVPIKEKASHSSVVAYNVLEHIADDVEALRALAGLVRSGGRLVILVPAFPVAMSRFDRSIGHYRRYTRGSLVGALAAADLSPLAVHYLNAPGLLAWIVAMRVLKMQPRAGTLLRLWDSLVPGFASLERRWSPPFGQSLFAVATPRGGGPD
jgi:SAM-dependent methyltransferase